METLKFKTNIKCGGCIATVTPFLDDVKGIDSWEVDTNSPEKILTVEGTASTGEVIQLIEKAGYMAEKI